MMCQVDTRLFAASLNAIFPLETVLSPRNYLTSAYYLNCLKQLLQQIAGQADFSKQFLQTRCHLPLCRAAKGTCLDPSCRISDPFAAIIRATIVLTWPTKRSLVRDNLTILQSWGRALLSFFLNPHLLSLTSIIIASLVSRFTHSPTIAEEKSLVERICRRGLFSISVPRKGVLGRAFVLVLGSGEVALGHGLVFFFDFRPVGGASWLDPVRSIRRSGRTPPRSPVRQCFFRLLSLAAQRRQ